MKSAPVPGESETVIATKTTDVEGRLSALLQETKELKVGLVKLFIHCILCEMNSREFYFISFNFSNSWIYEESKWDMILPHNKSIPILMTKGGTNEYF